MDILSVIYFYSTWNCCERRRPASFRWICGRPEPSWLRYCVWSILQEKVYGIRSARIDELKWAEVDHEIIPWMVMHQLHHAVSPF